MVEKCPECGAPVDVLAGAPLHPDNLYCTDKECDWSAWSRRQTRRSVVTPKALQAEELLMLFIADSYSSTGRPTKKTARALMRYVADRPQLQQLVNSGDKKEISKYRNPVR